MLLSAGEIASSLLAGDIHLGITGEDLLREAAPELEGRMHLVAPMGFGFADVVVAVSQYWIDVSTMADLDDVCAAYAARHRRRLRVATKYAQLTRGFFAHAGIADYRIVPSAGATEGAPAAGTAEVIVDITTTGATLQGQWPEGAGRRRDPEKPGPAGGFAHRRLGRGDARRLRKAAGASWKPRPAAALSGAGGAVCPDSYQGLPSAVSRDIQVADMLLLPAHHHGDAGAARRMVVEDHLLQRARDRACDRATASAPRWQRHRACAPH